MMQDFAHFVKQYLQLKDSDFTVEKSDYFNYIHITYGQLKFTIGYREEEKDMTFAKFVYENASEESFNIVQKIGNAFNEALNKGEHQTFFTTYSTQ